MSDVAERKLWDEYMHAYDDLIRQTSRPEAPWFVAPADNKWFTRLVVAAGRWWTNVFERARPSRFPWVEGRALKELHKAGKALKREKS